MKCSYKNYSNYLFKSNKPRAIITCEIGKNLFEDINSKNKFSIKLKSHCKELSYNLLKESKISHDFACHELCKVIQNTRVRKNIPLKILN